MELGGLDGVGWGWSCLQSADRTDQRFRQQRLDPAQWGLARAGWVCGGMSPGMPWTALDSASQGLELGGSSLVHSEAVTPVAVPR